MTTTKKPRKTTKTSAPIEDLPPNPFAFEVLNVVSKQRTTAKKVEALKKYEHDSLKALFIWNFAILTWTSNFDNSHSDS